jgi:hypothetical protein
MAKILVSDVCARRLSAAGVFFLLCRSMTGQCVITRSDFRQFPLFCALFFRCVAPVPARSLFLVPARLCIVIDANFSL